MWERLPWDSVTDVSSYPARGQHFHLDGIAAARLSKDRGVFAVIRLRMRGLVLWSCRGTGGEKTCVWQLLGLG